MTNEQTCQHTRMAWGSDQYGYSTGQCLDCAFPGRSDSPALPFRDVPTLGDALIDIKTDVDCLLDHGYTLDMGADGYDLSLVAEQIAGVRAELVQRRIDAADYRAAHIGPSAGGQR